MKNNNDKMDLRTLILPGASGKGAEEVAKLSLHLRSVAITGAEVAGQVEPERLAFLALMRAATWLAEDAGFGLKVTVEDVRG